MTLRIAEIQVSLERHHAFVGNQDGSALEKARSFVNSAKVAGPETGRVLIEVALLDEFDAPRRGRFLLVTDEEAGLAADQAAELIAHLPETIEQYEQQKEAETPNRETRRRARAGGKRKTTSASKRKTVRKRR